MNYYKANSQSEIKPDLSIPVLDHPWRSSYMPFKENAHENLTRCSECRLKFGVETLISIHPGVFLCRLCLKGGV